MQRTFDQPILRGGALPLHHQLRHLLRQRIESGEWPPGFRLPAERDLMRAFGVSRTTVRQALDGLEREGLIVRRHGQGTFVSRPALVEGLARLRGFTEELREQGLDYQVRLLRADLAVADDEVAKALGLQPGSEVVQISRVVWLDGQPLFTDDSWLVAGPGRLVLAAEPQGSIYLALEAVGFPVVRGEQTIEAAAATRLDARRLGIRRGQPVLVIRRVARMADGTPVEFRRVAYRGDRYRYRIALSRQGGPDGPA